MNDLRSLEGIGQLLRSKLKAPRHRRNSTTSIPTSTFIDESFPKEIAAILSVAIKNGFYRNVQKVPRLRKSHSNSCLSMSLAGRIDDDEYENSLLGHHRTPSPDYDDEMGVDLYDGFVSPTKRVRSLSQTSMKLDGTLYEEETQHNSGDEDDSDCNLTLDSHALSPLAPLEALSPTTPALKMSPFNANAGRLDMLSEQKTTCNGDEIKFDDQFMKYQVPGK